jgi:hypothetical protein
MAEPLRICAPDDMVIEMEQGLAVTSEGIQSQIT